MAKAVERGRGARPQRGLRPGRGPLLLAASLLVLLGAPRSLHAANEAHVRTPVLWPEVCGIVVERDLDPIVQLEYSIPLEDTELEDDELPDSRRHQFVALCRQHPASELLPAWITRDDLERSVEAGIVEPDTVTYREILDESSVWAGCFARITPDDARRPIDFETAAAGVSWDTSALAPGVWSVSGYTFEPPFNLWSDRAGFVKVVDSREDPAQDLPALALLNDEQSELEVGASLELETCADFLGPGELVFEWARFAPSLDWQPWMTLPLDEDAAFTAELQIPPEAAGLEIVLRARLIDAQAREFIAHAAARVSVAECSPMGCAEPDADEPPPPSADTPGGCSFETERSPLQGLFGVLLLAVLGLRRRAGISQWGKMGRQKND